MAVVTEVLAIVFSCVTLGDVLVASVTLHQFLAAIEVSIIKCIFAASHVKIIAIRNSSTFLIDGRNFLTRHFRVWHFTVVRVTTCCHAMGKQVLGERGPRSPLQRIPGQKGTKS